MYGDGGERERYIKRALSKSFEMCKVFLVLPTEKWGGNFSQQLCLYHRCFIYFFNQLNGNSIRHRGHQKDTRGSVLKLYH